MTDTTPSEYQCYGGPMDGATVPAHRVKNGRLVAGIAAVPSKQACKTIGGERVPGTSLVWAWDNTGPTVQYRLENGRLVFELEVRSF